MDSLSHQIRDLAEEIEIRSLCRTLQWIALEERNYRIQDISLRTYGIPITLTVIGALLPLEVDCTAPHRVSYRHEQVTVALLHLQMKMQLHAMPSPIRDGFPDVYVETSFSIRKSGNIITAYYR
jgi:hypothetical protein